MARCNLVIDSCCDLPADIVNQEGVYVLKFPYVVNGQTFNDDMFESQTPHDFYEGMRKGADPSTSQLSMPVVVELFEQLAQEGTPTVYLSFTSGMSGSFDVACMVADQIRVKYPDFELHVVDTLLASIAEGILVYEALRLRAKGFTASELTQWAQEARYFVNCKFMVDDLDTLHRGGRIPGSVAVAGAALDVKPLLNIDADGKLALVGVARGRKKGIKQLAECFEKRANAASPVHYVLIGHSDSPKEAQRLAEILRKIDENLMCIMCNIGPVIGSHVGPAMLALAFWGGDRRENISVADRIARRVKGGN